MIVEGLRAEFGLDASGYVRGMRLAATETGKFEATFHRMESSTSSAATRLHSVFMRMKSVMTSVLISLGTIATIRVFGKLITEAVEFEHAMAGIKKTIKELDTSPELFGQISDELEQMSLVVPYTAQELANIGRIAGQLDVPADKLSDFVKVIADLGVAVDDLSLEEAAFSLARISNVMGVPIEKARNLASAIVELGNTTASTEGEITHLATRMAPFANSAGITADQLLGLSATLAEMGIKAQEGGSSMGTALIRISEAAREGNEDLAEFARIAGMSTEKFRALALSQDGVAKAMVEFVLGIDRINKAGGVVTERLKDLELGALRVRRSMLAAGAAQQLLTENMRNSATAFEEGTAAGREANIFYETTKSNLKMLANHFSFAARAIGNDWLPMINDHLIPGMKDMALEFAKEGLINKYTVALAAFVAFLFRAKLAVLIAGIVTQLRFLAAGIGMVAGASNIYALQGLWAAMAGGGKVVKVLTAAVGGLEAAMGGTALVLGVVLAAILAGIESYVSWSDTVWLVERKQKSLNEAWKEQNTLWAYMRDTIAPWGQVMRLYGTIQLLQESQKEGNSIADLMIEKMEYSENVQKRLVALGEQQNRIYTGTADALFDQYQRLGPLTEASWELYQLKEAGIITEEKYNAEIQRLIDALREQEAEQRKALEGTGKVNKELDKLSETLMKTAKPMQALTDEMKDAIKLSDGTYKSTFKLGEVFLGYADKLVKARDEQKKLDAFMKAFNVTAKDLAGKGLEGLIDQYEKWSEEYDELQDKIEATTKEFKTWKDSIKDFKRSAEAMADSLARDVVEFGNVKDAVEHLGVSKDDLIEIIKREQLWMDKTRLGLLASALAYLEAEDAAEKHRKAQEALREEIEKSKNSISDKIQKLLDVREAQEMWTTALDVASISFEDLLEWMIAGRKELGMLTEAQLGEAFATAKANEERQKHIDVTKEVYANLYELSTMVPDLAHKIDLYSQAGLNNSQIVSIMGDEILKVVERAREFGIAVDNDMILKLYDLSEAVADQEKFAKKWEEAWNRSMADLVSNFAQSFTDMIFEAESFSESLIGIFKNLVKVLIQILIGQLFSPIIKIFNQFGQRLGDAFGKMLFGGTSSPFGGSPLATAGSFVPGLGSLLGMGGGAAGAAIGTGALLGVPSVFAGTALGSAWGAGALSTSMGFGVMPLSGFGTSAAAGVPGMAAGGAGGGGAFGGIMGALNAIPLWGWLAAGGILGGLGLYKMFTNSPSEAFVKELQRDFGGVNVGEDVFKNFTGSLGISQGQASGIRKDLASSPVFLQIAYQAAEAQGKTESFLRSLESVRTAWGSFNFRTAFEQGLETGNWEDLNAAFLNAFQRSKALTDVLGNDLSPLLIEAGEDAADAADKFSWSPDSLVKALDDLREQPAELATVMGRAVEGIAALRDAGATDSEILKILGQDLVSLVQVAEEFGVEVPEVVQQLYDLANAAGEVPPELTKFEQALLAGKDAAMELIDEGSLLASHIQGLGQALLDKGVPAVQAQEYVWSEFGSTLIDHVNTQKALGLELDWRIQQMIDWAMETGKVVEENGKLVAAVDAVNEAMETGRKNALGLMSASSSLADTIQGYSEELLKSVDVGAAQDHVWKQFGGDIIELANLYGELGYQLDWRIQQMVDWAIAAGLATVENGKLAASVEEVNQQMLSGGNNARTFLTSSTDLADTIQGYGTVLLDTLGVEQSRAIVWGNFGGQITDHINLYNKYGMTVDWRIQQMIDWAAAAGLVKLNEAGIWEVLKGQDAALSNAQQKFMGLTGSILDFNEVYEFGRLLLAAGNVDLNDQAAVLRVQGLVWEQYGNAIMSSARLQQLLYGSIDEGLRNLLNWALASDTVTDSVKEQIKAILELAGAYRYLADEFPTATDQMDAVNIAYGFEQQAKNRMRNIGGFSLDEMYRVGSDIITAQREYGDPFGFELIAQAISMISATKTFRDAFTELVLANSSGVVGPPSLPSFQSGIDYVPRDMFAYLHEGEMVVPAEHAEGGGLTVNVYVSGVLESSGFERTVRTVLVPELKRQMSLRRL